MTEFVKVQNLKPGMLIDLTPVCEEFEADEITVIMSENEYARVLDDPKVDDEGVIIFNTDQGDWGLPLDYSIIVVGTD